jgi:hypothetical protein
MKHKYDRGSKRSECWWKSIDTGMRSTGNNLAGGKISSSGQHGPRAAPTCSSENPVINLIRDRDYQGRILVSCGVDVGNSLIMCSEIDNHSNGPGSTRMKEAPVQKKQHMRSKIHSP